ncbi:MAG: exonuclease domain-containing protein, partial [Anaerolineae bacterium]
SPAYGDRVCEAACLLLRDGAEVGRFEALVDPGRPISPGAFRVNRITSEMLAGAPPFETIADPLLTLMEGTVLVAHNAPFDLGFFAMELEIAQMLPPEGPVVDTLALSRRVYRFASNSLPAVAQALKVETGPAHRAMGDVWTTRHVLERILWELDRRWGVTTLGQLLDFQGGPVPYPHSRTLPLPPTIAEALQTRAKVHMRYVDARGRETRRLVRPLRVSEHRGNLYLVAHCHQAGALRTFRLDRVVELVLELDDR